MFNVLYLITYYYTEKDHKFKKVSTFNKVSTEVTSMNNVTASIDGYIFYEKQISAPVMIEAHRKTEGTLLREYSHFRKKIYKVSIHSSCKLRFPPIFLLAGRICVVERQKPCKYFFRK